MRYPRHCRVAGIAELNPAEARGCKGMTSEDLPSSPALAPSVELLTLARIQDEVTRLQEDLNLLEDRVFREMAYDRQRITKLENGRILPCHQNRSEQLRALLVMNGGHMLQTDARRIMELSKSRLSELLASMKDQLVVRRSKTDKRRNILILK